MRHGRRGTGRVRRCSSLRGGDSNGKGESDLASGAPLDSVGGQENAGAVNVIYGSERRGLREDPDR